MDNQYQSSLRLIKHSSNNTLVVSLAVNAEPILTMLFS
jgi:hypothetical protein